MRRDWILIVAVVLVAASTVIASFTAQSGLGERAGWLASVALFNTVDLRLSWLLPLTVDAYGIAATRIATNKARYSAEVRGQAFHHALAAVAVSVVANAVFHLLEAHVIVLGGYAWVLVVAVSIVPPVALGGLAHVLSVAARDEVEAVAAEPVEDMPVIPRQVHEPVVPPQVTQVPDAGKPNADTLDEPPVVDVEVQPELVPGPDVDASYRPVAAATFLAEVVQGEPPTVRTIKDRMNVGTDRARRLQAYLGQLVEVTQ
ncbi:hypothetical protein PW035_02430 [Nonomuraea angiospora]|nr:hypothetical protein [Nonomuraea angiospora]